MMDFLRSSFEASPIGTIPTDFARLSELCTAASITFLDKEVNRKGQIVKYRDWRIVRDAEAAKDKKGRVRGSGSRNHQKFSMLLDLLQHEHRDWTRNSILGQAIEQIKKYHHMNWVTMNNELAMKGVNGYEMRKSKEKDFDIDL